jgi:hypothetical protein
MDVEVDDSRERGSGWTSISSFGFGFRFFGGGGSSVFMLEREAAAALRFEEEERARGRVMVPLVCVGEGVTGAADAVVVGAVVDRVWRTGGLCSGVSFRGLIVMLCFIVLAYGDPSGSYRVSESESKQSVWLCGKSAQNDESVMSSTNKQGNYSQPRRLITWRVGREVP